MPPTTANFGTPHQERGPISRIMVACELLLLETGRSSPKIDSTSCFIPHIVCGAFTSPPLARVAWQSLMLEASSPKSTPSLICSKQVFARPSVWTRMCRTYLPYMCFCIISIDRDNRLTNQKTTSLSAAKNVKLFQKALNASKKKSV